MNSDLTNYIFIEGLKCVYIYMCIPYKSWDGPFNSNSKLSGIYLDLNRMYRWPVGTVYFSGSAFPQLAKYGWDVWNTFVLVVNLNPLNLNTKIIIFSFKYIYAHS